VTGLLVTSALLVINGRQNKTEFQTAINDLKQQIQQIVNETSSGYFPGNGSFNCSASTGSPPTLTNTASAQGTNAGCVFLGKFIQFGVHGTDPQQFPVYPIAGNRLDATSQQASTLYGSTGTWPVAVAAGSSYNNSLTNSMVTTNTLKNGLTAVLGKMTYTKPGGGGGSTGAVGFLSSLGSYSGSGCSGSLCSGSQQVGLYVSSSAAAALNATQATVVDAIDTPNAIIPAAEVDICFASGTTNQSGLITIGGGSQQLSVQLSIKNGLVC